MRYFDLYHGAEIDPEEDSDIHLPSKCNEGRPDKGVPDGSYRNLDVDIETLGIGAVLSLVMKPDDGPPTSLHSYTESIEAILALMDHSAALSKLPLAGFDKSWRPLPQTITPNPPTPLVPDAPAGMVTLPAAVYEYSSSNNCIEGDELPQAVGVQMPWQTHPARAHSQRISIHKIHMDKHLVTNADYLQYLNRGNNEYFAPRDRTNWLKEWEGGVIPDGYEQRPVRWISLADADAYCKYYDKRLPSSAEWQYAAQGTDGRRYPWGDEWDSANVPPLSNGHSDPPTMDVGSFPNGASQFGVEDLVGHLYQWTDEFCDAHTCRAIVRGGSNYYPHGSRWYFPQPGCPKGNGCTKDAPRGDLGVHNTLLLLDDSMDRSASIGFRCVVDAEAPPLCPYELCGSLLTQDDWGDSHDLSAEGNAGWVAWGPLLCCSLLCDKVPTPPGCIEYAQYEKAGFAKAVRIDILGDDVSPSLYTNAEHTLAWSDGVKGAGDSSTSGESATPTTSNIGIFVEGVGSGFSINLPASVGRKTTARLYVGVYLGRGELSIAIEGGSHYRDDSLLGMLGASSGVYTIVYETRDNWPVEARWVLAEETETALLASANVALQAVTLQRDEHEPTPSPTPAGTSRAANASQPAPLLPGPTTPPETMAGVGVGGAAAGLCVGVALGLALGRAGVCAKKRRAGPLVTELEVMAGGGSAVEATPGAQLAWDDVPIEGELPGASAARAE